MNKFLNLSVFSLLLMVFSVEGLATGYVEMDSDQQRRGQKRGLTDTLFVPSVSCRLCPGGHEGCREYKEAIEMALSCTQKPLPKKRYCQQPIQDEFSSQIEQYTPQPTVPQLQEELKHEIEKKFLTGEAAALIECDTQKRGSIERVCRDLKKHLVNLVQGCSEEEAKATLNTFAKKYDPSWDWKTLLGENGINKCIVFRPPELGAKNLRLYLREKTGYKA